MNNFKSIKRISFSSLFLVFSLVYLSGYSQAVSEKINLNQLGYFLNESKWAYISDTVTLSLKSWDIRTSSGDTSVLHSTAFSSPDYDESTAEYVYKLDFSHLNTPGSYYIELEDIGRSYDFEISEAPYNNAFEMILKGFYYQRSGVEISEDFAGKWARPAEYSDDAYIYTGFEKDLIQFGDHVNTNGGWRDAGDANKKVVPSSIAVYFLMLLYEYFPGEVSEASWMIPDHLSMDC